jgi:hypothetical protein
MGSIALDNSESVYIHDSTGSADPVAISAAEGSSLANLMKNRERFDYTWADQSERAAQLGMVQGSRGYQEDIKSEYLFDNGAWRLALPYIEFTASNINVPDTTFYGAGVLSVDSASSTDTTMVTSPSTDVLRFVNPGIYSVQSHWQLRNSSDTGWAPVTARSFIDLVQTGGTGLTPIHRYSVGSGEDQLSFSIPSLRVVSSNSDYTQNIYKTNGVGSTLVKTRVRIARIG